MDILAKKLAIGPFEIRRVNAIKTGSETATGQVLTKSVGICECLDAVLPYYEKEKKLLVESTNSPFIKKGIGLGAMFYGIGNTGIKNPSTARIEIDLSGRVSVYTGCADIGQGLTTVLAQIAAEVLGLAPESINMIAADTKKTLDAGATSASRQTYISGNAVKDAAEKLANALKIEAPVILKLPLQSLVLDSGFVVDFDNSDNKASFSEIAKQAMQKNISLSFDGYFDPETSPMNPETGQGAPYATYAFACQMAVISVDALTGRVSVDKIVAAHDVGKAVNPEGIRGRICGGVAMGVGFALSV